MCCLTVYKLLKYFNEPRPDIAARTFWVWTALMDRQTPTQPDHRAVLPRPGAGAEVARSRATGAGRHSQLRAGADARAIRRAQPAHAQGWHHRGDHRQGPRFSARRGADPGNGSWRRGWS